MQKSLSLAFIWHFHQPLYKSKNGNLYLMPWVRLHAVKDYLDMLTIIEKYPTIKLNINISPLLLDAIEDYVNNFAHDIHSKLTITPFEELSLADKTFMKRICRDAIVKKCIAKLFHLYNSQKFYKMRDCLKFIYKNYFKFRKYVDKGSDIEENIIFNQLNKRILQLFPQMAYGEEIYYNPMINNF